MADTYVYSAFVWMTFPSIFVCNTYTEKPEQDTRGLIRITESSVTEVEIFLRVPSGENEYMKPSREPIEIQPAEQKGFSTIKWWNENTNNNSLI